MTEPQYQDPAKQPDMLTTRIKRVIHIIQSLPVLILSLAICTRSFAYFGAMQPPHRT